MKVNYALLRNLPYLDWHKPYHMTCLDDLSLRYSCNCPWGSHNGTKIIDHRDPLNFLEIINLKKNSRLLTLSCDNQYNESIAYHEFNEIEIKANSIIVRFKGGDLPEIYNSGYYQPNFDEKKNQFHYLHLSLIRYIAVIERSELFIPFGLAGDLDIYINALALLIEIKRSEVAELINNLGKQKIPKSLQLDCRDYFKIKNHLH